MRALPAALVLALASTAVAADATGLMVRERTNANGAVTEVTTYYTADKVITDAPRQRTVVDLSAKTVTMVDKAAKSYAVAPFDAMGRQGEAMRQRFTAMPEEQRKKIVGDAADAKVKPTGKSETILGRPAKEYEISAGPVTGLVWVVEGVAVPAGRAAWEKQQSGIRPYVRPIDRYTDAIAGMKGVVVRKATTMTVDGTPKPISEQEVVELKETAPPADMLGVPEGFNKVALPGID
jgi:hypothetical protein